MNKLIKIESSTLNSELVQTVNARELHSFLGSQQQFANWIQSRIADYEFIEGQDFLINLLKTPNGGRPSKEYHISINMAKELSMVERNEKGRQARQYFINCEKKLLTSNNRGSKSYLPEFRQARAMDLATKAINSMFEHLPHLGEKSKQTIFASVLNPIAGVEIIPLPALEHKTYSATEVGEQLGISANKVGKIANQLGLKVEEYGMFVLDKSRYSSKQVESFRYNDRGVDVIRDFLISGGVAA